jgi:uncharacterized protein with von Willebrand factor type A (vWA) domain
MLLTVAELLWSLRREGFSISTAQSLDAARVVELVGFDDRTRLRVALGAVLATTREENHRFGAVFDAFFAVDRGHPGDLFDRLRGRGFAAGEISMLSDMLFAVAERSGESGDGAALRVLTHSPFELDHLLRAARIKRVTRGLTSATMVGFFTERVARELGLDRAASALTRVGQVLEEALGSERGAAMTAALREELDAMKRRLRAELLAPLDRAAGATLPAGRRSIDLPFGALSGEEAREVRQAVRELAAELRGALRVRRRRAKRGPIDPGRTARAAMRTGGIPLRLVRRRRRDERPKLVLLCDLSESVRLASRYMLEFVAVASDLFESSRSFVFVADLVETTALFSEEATDDALRTLASGALLDLGQSSNYGRVLAAADRVARPLLDKRTTVVLLGDGRTNHLADGSEHLAAIRARARALVWICPEAPQSWAIGDSHMRRYAELSTSVVVARTARELASAMRGLVRRA